MTKILDGVTAILKSTKQPIRIILGETDYNQVEQEIKESIIAGEQTVLPDVDKSRVNIATFVKAESLNLGPTAHYIIVKDEQTT